MDEPATPTKRPRASVKKAAAPTEPSPYSLGVRSDAPLCAHSPLRFSFDEAKRHLIEADARFAPLFASLTVKPFEIPEGQSLDVNPWRSLVTSILGQQVSWLAARSVCSFAVPS